MTLTIAALVKWGEHLAEPGLREKARKTWESKCSRPEELCCEETRHELAARGDAGSRNRCAETGGTAPHLYADGSDPEVGRQRAGSRNAEAVKLSRGGRGSWCPGGGRLEEGKASVSSFKGREQRVGNRPRRVGVTDWREPTKTYCFYF